MQYFWSLEQSAQMNRCGAFLLASGRYDEALTKFVDAFQTVEAIRNTMETALVGKGTPNNHSSFSVATNKEVPPAFLEERQKLFSMPCCSSQMATQPQQDTMFDESADDGCFVFEKVLCYKAESLPQKIESSYSSSTYFQVYQPTLNLLLAASTFNMALSYHLSSRSCAESSSYSAQQVANKLYNAVIESLSGNGCWYTLDTANLNMDEACLLAVALNNKAIICYETAEYSQCEASRALLVLVLNALLSSKSTKAAQSSIYCLNNHEIVRCYRNGLLLETPTTAQAA